MKWLIALPALLLVNLMNSSRDWRCDGATTSTRVPVLRPPQRAAGLAPRPGRTRAAADRGQHARRGADPGVPASDRRPRGTGLGQAALLGAWAGRTGLAARPAGRHCDKYRQRDHHKEVLS